MKTYQISYEDLSIILTKLDAAQTLLNVNCVALSDDRKPVPSKVRLDLAEDAEELINDTVEILYRMKRQNDAG